ncbi:unnamed protein product [Prunus armeniaca]
MPPSFCMAHGGMEELERDLGEFVLLVEEMSCRASQGWLSLLVAEDSWSRSESWWLLSEYREEVGGLPYVQYVEKWKQNGRYVKSSRNEATTSLVKDVTPLRKKPRIPYAEKTQVRVVLSPSARFKHLVGAYSKKIDDIRNVRDVPLESPTDKLGDYDLQGVYLPRSKKMLVFLSEVLVICTSQGMEIELGGVLIRSTITIQLLSHEHSSVDKPPVKPVCLLQAALAAETIRNSSDVAFSYAIDLVSRKDAYFRLERKNADVSFSFDKLLARFGAYNKSDEKS